jgi:predicted permease
VKPDELARFYATVRREDNTEVTSSGAGYVLYTTLRDQTRSFAGVAATNLGQRTLGRGADAEPIPVAGATWDLFPLLGVRTHLGRFFTADEDRPPVGENVIVLGHSLWKRRFGGEPSVLGREILLDGEPYTVIGIAKPEFTGAGLNRTDAWVPMTVVSRTITTNWPEAWNAQWLRVVARLRPGVTFETASADATQAFQRAYAGRSEAMRHARITVQPLRYNQLGREPLEVSISRWLLAVTAIVLLVACANVASLLLARAMRRRQEVAVRLALGISRGRLVRLLMLHGLFLAVAGGVVAVALAHFGATMLGSVLLPDVDWGASPLNPRVLALTALVALATGLATAILPATRAARPDLGGMLRSGRREGAGRTARVRAGLTVLQAALSVVLLVGAGLFVRSLANVRSLHLGLEPDRVLNLTADWPRLSVASAETRDAQRQREQDFYTRALERARALPGVRYAALAVGTPFNDSFTVDLRVSGRDSIPEMAGGGPYISAVSSDYFEAVGTRLRGGRLFTPADRAGSEPVAIVNETMARLLWPGQSALGQCLHVNEQPAAPAPCSRVVGIVEDARRFGLREEPAMQYYIPFGQERGFGGTRLIVRPLHQPERMIAPLRAELIPLDASVQYIGIETLQDSLDPQIRPWRLGASMFSLFGGLALLVAAIGLYSVIAYSVASRTHELGVRMALGAGAAQVIRLVVRQGTAMASAGVGIGTLLALAFSQRLETVLFEATPRDPAVFILVALTMLLVAALACLIPAIRAARISPVSAFRVE